MKKKFSIEEVLKLEKSNFSKSNFKTITFFKNKGFNCSCCNRKGSYFLKKNNAYLLFTFDGILMTKDHIFPKSKGGSNSFFNLQPMCSSCNLKKGNSIPSSKLLEKENVINIIKNISSLLKKKSLSKKNQKYISNFLNKNELETLNSLSPINYSVLHPIISKSLLSI